MMPIAIQESIVANKVIFIMISAFTTGILFVFIVGCLYRRSIHLSVQRCHGPYKQKKIEGMLTTVLNWVNKSFKK